MATIYNDKSNTLLSGTSGNDEILSYGDSVTIKGNDSLTGSKSADIFIYSGGNDVITDYSPDIDTVVILSSVKIENPEADTLGDVTFKIGTGQITFQNSADKYIQLVDKAGNIFSKYNPR